MFFFCFKKVKAKQTNKQKTHTHKQKNKCKIKSTEKLKKQGSRRAYLRRDGTSELLRGLGLLCFILFYFFFFCFFVCFFLVQQKLEIFFFLDLLTTKTKSGTRLPSSLKWLASGLTHSRLPQVGMIDDATFKMPKKPSKVTIDELPSWYRPYASILSGYRLGFNYKTATCSCFTWHNETVNSFLFFLFFSVFWF